MNIVCKVPFVKVQNTICGNKLKFINCPTKQDNLLVYVQIYTVYVYIYACNLCWRDIAYIIWGGSNCELTALSLMMPYFTLSTTDGSLVTFVIFKNILKIVIQKFNHKLVVWGSTLVTSCWRLLFVVNNKFQQEVGFLSLVHKSIKPLLLMNYLMIHLSPVLKQTTTTPLFPMHFFSIHRDIGILYMLYDYLSGTQFLVYHMSVSVNCRMLLSHKLEFGAARYTEQHNLSAVSHHAIFKSGMGCHILCLTQVSWIILSEVTVILFCCIIWQNICLLCLKTLIGSVLWVPVGILRQ